MTGMISRSNGRTKRQTESLVVEISAPIITGVLLPNKITVLTGSHDGSFTISFVTVMGGIEDIGSDIASIYQ